MLKRPEATKVKNRRRPKKKSPAPPKRKKLQLSKDASEFLELLHPDTAFEIRVLGALSTEGPEKRCTYSVCWQGDYDRVAEECCDFDRNYEPKGVYVTLNPVRPELATAKKLEFKESPSSTTKNEDITGRRWLLVDIDPIRNPDESATDEERNEAKRTARKIADDLRTLGWPYPVRCRSGNGAYLLYRIDLPNDKPAADLVKRVTAVLAAKYTSEHVDIDKGVWNANRLIRVMGTTARKGQNCQGGEGSPAREWREAYFFPPKKPPRIVKRSLLKRLASDFEEAREARGTVSVGKRARNDAKRNRSKPGELGEVEYVQPEHILTPGDIEDAPAEIVARCRGYIEKLPDAVSGNGGHDSTFAYVCAMARFGLSVEQAKQLLREINAKKCKPPWNEKELQHKLKDGYDSVLAESAVGQLAASAPVKAGTGSPLPEILHIEGHTDETVVEVSRVLGENGLIYRLEATGKLVTVRQNVHELVGAGARQFIDQHLQLVRPAEKDRVKAIDCPQELARRLVESIDLPGIQTIKAVVDGPAIVEGGRIIDECGYDEPSGIYVKTVPEQWKSIVEKPTRQDAVQAVELLLGVVTENSFEHEAGPLGWVAMILTAVGSQLMMGRPKPAFALTAHAPNSGKSTLIELASIIALGDRISTRELKNDTELGKDIVTAMRKSSRWLAMDNLQESHLLRSPLLAEILTSGKHAGRILGENSEVSGDVPFIVTLTCNNMSYTTEMARRVLTIQLKRRPDGHAFTVKDPLESILSRRMELLGAAMTVLRWAQIAKVSELEPISSYACWCRSIRDPLVALGFPDVGRLVDFSKSLDDDREQLREIVSAIEYLIVAKNVAPDSQDRRGLKPAELCALISKHRDRRRGMPGDLNPYHQDLHYHAQVLHTHLSSRRGDTLVTPESLGRRLSQYEDRWIDGRRIRRGSHRQIFIERRAEE